MLIIVMILTIIATISLICTDWEEFTLFSIGAFVFETIVLVYLLNGLVSMRVIDNKIKLYESQNKEIENKVEITVKNYMEYEGNTYKELKSDNYIQLVNLYPDLKADQLIQQQMTLYTKNNNKIIKLKEEKLNKTIYKWWLYFGK
jgi:hypothetical protein